MGQSILDVASAAEIMGVDKSTVLGWCNNHIINCQNAPDEYADKTKYLIREDECDYISGLIKKFGVRGALLNYKKCWKGSVNNEIVLTNSVSQTVVSQTVKEQKPAKPQNVTPKPTVSDNQIIPKIKESIVKKTNTDKLVSSIMYAHQLKEKIDEFKAELSKLEDEYTKLKDSIVSHL